jgi:MFS family permease
MRPELPSRPEAARFRPISLDALNFLLADVRGALGPFLNVFLVTQQAWSQSSVGLMTTISGLLGLAAQTPAGAAIDATRAKRGVLVAALAILGVAAVAIFAMPTFGPVFAANTVMAVVGDVFGPAVAALTLGLFSVHELARRMGRNSAFDHAGNVMIATVACDRLAVRAAGSVSAGTGVRSPGLAYRPLYSRCGDRSSQGTRCRTRFAAHFS